MPDNQPDNRSEVLPMVEEGVGSFDWWKKQLDWSDKVRKGKMDLWRTNIRRYMSDDTLARDQIRVNIEFEKVEQKKPQLIFQTPYVKLKPKPGANPPVEDAVRVFERVINDLIGPDEVNTKAVTQEVLFDVLCPAGIGAAEVGYEAYQDGTRKVQVGEEPDPSAPPAQPGSILGLSAPAPMKPIYDDVPNIVAEKYFVDRISPAKFLIPPDFDGSDYDKAPWLGYDFYLDRAEAVRKGWVSKDDEESTVGDEERLVDIEQKGESRRGTVKGRLVYYYASRIDPEIVHPDLVRKLVFIEGKESPVVHEDSRLKVFEDGRFIMGIEGLPIKVLTLRYVSDTPFPPSDVSVARRQIDELSEGRTQMSKQRKRAGPLRWVNLAAMVDEEQVERIKRGEVADIIALNQKGDEVLGEMARAAFPRENFTFNGIIQDDINRMFSLGANQSATSEGTKRPATELALIQRATDTRLSGEQMSVIEFFISIVKALATLVQMFHTEVSYAQVVGPDGVARMVAWDRTTVAGRYLFDVLPDSFKRPDVQSERELAMTRYNLLANDPFTNRKELVKETYEILGSDATRLVKDPEPPSPEKPKLSFSIKPEDLILGSPTFAGALILLQVAGIDVSGLLPQPTAPAGPTGPADVVDRETLETTGGEDGRLGGFATTGVQ